MRDFLRKMLPQMFLSAYHYALAFFAACIYRFPARKLKVIGITGTNGKTTTVHMMHDIFKHAGYSVCSASSVRFAMGEKEFPNMLKMTMAGPFVLQKFLRDAVQKGCRFAILEITSEGILQHREAFIPIDMAVLTNISPEHIERHGSFEAYLQAKSQIFKGAKRILINCDDEQANYFLNVAALRRGSGQAPEKYGYSFDVNKAHAFAPLKKLFMMQGGQGQFTAEGATVRISLPGQFNLRNAAEAFAIGKIYGVPGEVAKYALEKIQDVPGRMEIVAGNPTVVVDYAHTPVALRNVYETLRSANTKYEIRNTKLICVLGATGGGRDKWKRPEFGKLAAAYCDHIILTNEDPYDENPLEIIAQVKSGISASFPGKIEEVLDRKEAIARALAAAKKDDTVVITGKGSEPYMVTKKGKIPWDDRAIAREAIQGRTT